MIPHTQTFADAVSQGYSIVSQVDVYRGTELMYLDVPIVGGSVDTDRGSNTRYSCSLQIGLRDWQRYTDINSTTCQVVVRRGITTLGYTELLPQGVYRVDKVQRGAGGVMEVKGLGQEMRVIADRFLAPRQPPYGQSTVQAMVDLIGESMLQRQGVVALNTYDKPVRMTAPWDRDRIKALTALATSIKAEVYCDATGTWVIVDDPTLQLAAPVFTIAAGDGGLLIDYGEGSNRDGVYNGVVVNGREAEEEGQPPISAVAVDDDPTSDTRWDGPFGHVPRFYSNDGIDTVADCLAIAKSFLRAALTPKDDFQFTSAAVCFLEAGDVVRVQLPDKTWKDYLLDSTSLDLGVNGTLSAKTYQVRGGGDVQ